MILELPNYVTTISCIVNIIAEIQRPKMLFEKCKH